MLLSMTVSQAKTTTPILERSEVLHCKAGFYDHFNGRYVNVYDLKVYSDLSFFLGASVLYGSKVIGWGKMKNEATIELIQDINFGRRAFLGTLVINEYRSEGVLSIYQNHRQTTLACQVEKI